MMKATMKAPLGRVMNLQFSSHISNRLMNVRRPGRAMSALPRARRKTITMHSSTRL